MNLNALVLQICADGNEAWPLERLTKKYGRFGPSLVRQAFLQINTNPEAPGAAFIGVQECNDPFVRIRLYNITGPHPLSGSTVTADTLLKHSIPVPDLSQEQLQEELEKIKILYESL